METNTPLQPDLAARLDALTRRVAALALIVEEQASALADAEERLDALEERTSDA